MKVCMCPTCAMLPPHVRFQALLQPNTKLTPTHTLGIWQWSSLGVWCYDLQADGLVKVGGWVVEG